MRLSELIGRPVTTTEGSELGKVFEALLIQDGPIVSEATASFRLHGLAVGRHRVGSHLGYIQGTVEGPALLRRAFTRPYTMVPWDAIVSLDDDRIIVDAERVGAEDL